jgi:hypothetical protein
MMMKLTNYVQHDLNLVLESLECHASLVPVNHPRPQNIWQNLKKCSALTNAFDQKPA